MLQFIHLCNETFWVNNHTITDNTGGIGIKNTRGDKTECKLPFFVNDPVSCIVATLVAHDKIRVHRQLIYNFSFAFVAPLCADYCDNRHVANPSLLLDNQTK